MSERKEKLNAETGTDEAREIIGCGFAILLICVGVAVVIAVGAWAIGYVGGLVR